jgi:hypothetical protein
VRVKRQPRPDQPLTNAEVAVEVAGPAGKTGAKSVTVELRANAADPDLFTGTFYPSAGGQYEVTAALKEGGNTVANQASEFLVHGRDLELADKRTNVAGLQALAQATGGQYFEIDDADKVAKALPHKERHFKEVQRSEFWINPALSLFFLAAVAAEWFIRRRNHLV